MSPEEAIADQTIPIAVRIVIVEQQRKIKVLEKESYELRSKQSWENPYTKAISVLEDRARAFEGGYG